MACRWSAKLLLLSFSRFFVFWRDKTQQTHFARSPFVSAWRLPKAFLSATARATLIFMKQALLRNSPGKAFRFF